MDLNKLELAKSVSDYIINHRRNLHKIPEIGLNLPLTMEYVTKELRKLGIEYEEFEDISCIVGVINGERSSKTISLRADMDGLPIVEDTGLDFSSTNDNMHACGHDGHMAILLGAAKLLQGIRNELHGNVKIIFQGGEEYPGGAKPLIERGILKDVSTILGLHGGIIDPSIPKGHIGFKTGPIMASMDRFLIKVIGKGGHGAHPEDTIDSINIACEIVQSLNKIVARQIPPTEPAILSVTRIDGGFNQNILPDIVEIEGTCRSTNEDIRQFIYRRIGEVSSAIAAGYGGKTEYVYDFKYPAVQNDEAFTKFVIESTKKLVAPRLIDILKVPVMASDDMSFYFEEIPGTYFFLSNPKGEKDYISHHRSDFDIDEDLMYLGVGVFVQVCLDYLS